MMLYGMSSIIGGLGLGSLSNKKSRSRSKSKSKSKSKNNHKNNHKSNNYHDTKDCKRLRNTLDADGLEIVEMCADGNCLFRSLSDQLYGDYGKMHDEVRSAVCGFMEANKGDFQVFLVFEDEDDEDQNEEDARDFEDYIENMREQGQWGGNLEVVAAARCFRRNVTVYSETMAAFTIDHGESKSRGPDLLVSYHDNDHYNSVRNKLQPPTPPRTKVSPTNGQTSTSTSIQINNNAKAMHEDSLEIECISSALSELLLSDDNIEGTTDSKSMKTVKRSAPCPCGSGLRYKKCCLAKQKHAVRVDRLKAKKKEEGPLSSDTDEETGSPEMFRVVAI
eukprot:jgi/Psemu1/294765/fgenesh1_pm.30_\